MTLALLSLALLPVVAPQDTVHATLGATIAEDSPTHAFYIGEVSGLAVDAQGRVFVSDFQEPRVLVFGPDGQHLATIGRKGQGPGEFTAPTGPVIGPNGALYVRNLSQVVQFVPPSPGAVPSRFGRVLEGPPMAPWRSRLPSAIDSQGRFYFPLEVGLADGLTHYAYRRYSLDGRALDSVPVPVHPTTRSSWASVPVAPGTGRMVRGVNVVPFHPVPQWTITQDGTILSGPADSPELMETDVSQKIIRRLKVPDVSTPIPAAERAESLRALKARLDSIHVPLSEVRGMSEEVRSQRLPGRYPEYRALLSVAQEIWIVRWSPPSLATRTVVDVVDRTGRPLHTLVLPASCEADPAPAVGGRTVACLVVDRETGAQSIAISRLP